MSVPSATRNRALPLALAASVFLAVALLVVITATVITFMLPEAFASTCRIRVDPSLGSSSATDSQEPHSTGNNPAMLLTELETIQSEAVLGRVIEDLDLNAEWGRRYLHGEPLRTSESLMILKRRLELRPVGGSRLIEVRVLTDDPEEAARIANNIAKAYIEFAATHSEGIQALIVDSAYPSVIPVLPNKQLNITLGIVVGVTIGLACGLLTYWIASKWQGLKPAPINPPPKVVESNSGTPAETLDSLHKRF